MNLHVQNLHKAMEPAYKKKKIVVGMKPLLKIGSQIDNFTDYAINLAKGECMCWGRGGGEEGRSELLPLDKNSHEDLQGSWRPGKI